jgi:hypothetical protein
MNKKIMMIIIKGISLHRMEPHLSPVHSSLFASTIDVTPTISLDVLNKQHTYRARFQWKRHTVSTSRRCWVEKIVTSEILQPPQCLFVILHNFTAIIHKNVSNLNVSKRKYPPNYSIAQTMCTWTKEHPVLWTFLHILLNQTSVFFFSNVSFVFLHLCVIISFWEFPGFILTLLPRNRCT